jgi:hypothetical protein
MVKSDLNLYRLNNFRYVVAPLPLTVLELLFSSHPTSSQLPNPSLVEFGRLESCTIAAASQGCAVCICLQFPYSPSSTPSQNFKSSAIISDSSRISLPAPDERRAAVELALVFGFVICAFFGALSLSASPSLNVFAGGWCLVSRCSALSLDVFAISQFLICSGLRLPISLNISNGLLPS